MIESLRNPFIVIIALGVPGVGKTTVMKELINQASGEGIKVVVKNIGDYMVSEALSRGLVKNRDELRYLKIRQQLELQMLAAKALLEDARKELDENGVLIVDTHAVINTKYGLWTGIPKPFVDVFKPDAFVIIEASVDEILSRQLRDKTRYRADMAKPEKIKELMELTRRNAFAAALFYSSLVYIVENKEGKAAEAASRILEIIKGLR